VLGFSARGRGDCRTPSTHMLNGVLRNHPFLIRRDDIDVDPACLRRDLQPCGAVGVLVEDDA
jgi:hypothetical protein